MRSFLELNLSVSNDDDQLEKLFDQVISFDDNDDTRNEECSVQRITLAAAAVDSAVNFGPVSTASILMVVAYSNITVKLNGSTVSLQVNITPATADGTVLSRLQKFAQPGVLFLRGAVTSLSVSNPSGTVPASVVVVLVGNQI